MADSMHIVCPSCGAVNRIPGDKNRKEANCGKCRRPLLSAKPLNVGEELFAKIISRSELPVLVDFWASWCGPCKMMAPQFEAAAVAQHGEVIYLKVNTEQEQQAAARYAIRSIPTMVLFQDGRETARTSGAMSAVQIQQWVDSKR